MPETICMETRFSFLILFQLINEIFCKNDEFCDTKLIVGDTVHWYWEYLKTPQILKDGLYVFKKDEYWLYTTKSFLIGKPTKVTTDWRAFSDNSAIEAPVSANAIWTEFVYKMNRIQHTVTFAKEKYCYKYIFESREFIELINCSSYFKFLNSSFDLQALSTGVLVNLETYLKKPIQSTAARYRSIDVDSYILPSMVPYMEVTLKKPIETIKSEVKGPIHRYLNVFFTTKMTAMVCYTELSLSAKGEQKRDCFEYQNVKPQINANNYTYIKIMTFFQNFVESALNALGDVVASHEMSSSIYVFNTTHHCIFPIKQLMEETSILPCKPQSNDKFFNCTQQPISTLTQEDRLIYSVIMAIAVGLIFAFGDYFYDQGFEAGLRGPQYDDEAGFK